MSGNTDLSADGYFSSRDFTQDYTDAFLLQNHDSGTADQYGGSVSLGHDFAQGWRTDLTIVDAKTKQDRVVRSDIPSDPQRWVATVRSAELQADGALASLPGGELKASIGTAYRNEKFVTAGGDRLERNIASAYGELLIPIIGPANSTSFARRLELSVAGRFDDYDDAGSSTDPKFGIAWSPVDGVIVRGSYATSFRAPLLSSLNPAGQSYFTLGFPDPAANDGETVALVTATPQNPILTPETSRSYTLGFELKPQVLPGFSLSATYFSIDFEDRISAPPVVGDVFDIFSQTDVLAPFINFNPTLSDIERIYGDPLFANFAGVDPSDVEAFVDLRPHNIGSTKTSGVELTTEQAITSSVGDLSLFFAGSYLFELSTRPLVTTPPRTECDQ